MSDEKVPFYAQAALLDQYIHMPNPSADQEMVAVVIDMLERRADMRSYFFRSGPSVGWAQILWDHGFLSHPPEPQKTIDGFILPPWEAQYYLVSIARQVPKIVTKHVRTIQGDAWYLAKAVEAAVRIPASSSEAILPTIIGWLRAQKSFSVLYEPVAALMHVMVEARRIRSALGLFDGLTAPLESLQERSVNTHFLRDKVIGSTTNPAADFKFLRREAPESVIQILERHLLDEDAGNWGNESPLPRQYQSWWRSAIEDSDQDQLDTYQDVILCGLRDSLDDLAASSSLRAKAVIERYLESPHSILRRLSLYLVRVHRDSYKELVTTQLLSRQNIDDTDIHHEYFGLLDAGFPLLAGSDREALLQMILQGPNSEHLDAMADWAEKTLGENRAEYMLTQKRLWVRNRLWMIRGDLRDGVKSVLDELVEQYGEPDHPGFLAWTSGIFSVVDVSPFQVSELSRLSPDELIRRIAKWQAPSDQRFGPKRESHQGLASMVAEIVLADSERYSGQFDAIASVRPEYANAILGRWLNPGSKHAIVWDVAISLCESLLANADVRKDLDDGGEGRNWTEVRLSISRLAQMAVSRDARSAPEEYLPKVRDLLLRLVDDPDPQPENERPQEGWTGYNNPSTLALNHVRPIAVAALIEYAARQMSLWQDTSTPVSIEPVVVAALSMKVNSNTESSRAVHSVFGRYFPTLYWLSKEWITTNLHLIFPQEADDESRSFFMSAWDSYVLNRYHPKLFDLLRAEYERELGYWNAGFATKSFVEPANHLVIHLAFKYLSSETVATSADRKTSLLARFAETAAAESRGKAGWALFIICRDNPDHLDEYWIKSKAFWEWRAQEAAAAGHAPDFREEMGEYAQLLLVAPDSENIATLRPLLEGLLPYMHGSEFRDLCWNSVESFLAGQVIRDPLKVIQFYRLMYEQKANPAKLMFHTDHTKKIIEVTAANPESRSDALALIDLMARWGDFKFKPVYERYSKLPGGDNLD